MKCFECGREIPEGEEMYTIAGGKIQAVHRECGFASQRLVAVGGISRSEYRKLKRRRKKK